jgi:hypothetical protein
MLEKYVIKILQRVINRIAVTNLRKNLQLWQELTTYQKKTKSTGCSNSDYWELYKAIRIRKPKEVLECGPGVSTLIMSYALMENEKEGFPGRITAMEQSEVYFKMSMELIPKYLLPFVEFKLSPCIEDYFSLFRGIRYRDVPDRHYDFIFVDGPELHAPSDGALTFDFDYIHIVKNSDLPVYGIVDYRLSTSYVFQIAFGMDKVKFDGIRELAFVGPCTKDDLVQLELESLTTTLLKNVKLFGNTQLRLR